MHQEANCKENRCSYSLTTFTSSTHEHRRTLPTRLASTYKLRQQRHRAQRWGVDISYLYSERQPGNWVQRVGGGWAPRPPYRQKSDLFNNHYFIKVIAYYEAPRHTSGWPLPYLGGRRGGSEEDVYTETEIGQTPPTKVYGIQQKMAAEVPGDRSRIRTACIGSNFRKINILRTYSRLFHFWKKNSRFIIVSDKLFSYVHRPVYYY